MLVSVIMPTYNCGKFILQSLDSVIAQTVTDWEVQIVDDCSTDNTAAMSCTATMSCAAALGLHYALNCTIFDATVAPVFSPDDTITRYGSPCLYSRAHSSTLQ